MQQEIFPPYTALTIDTSVLRANGYKFTTGLLAQLQQFKDANVKLVFSEVVIGEVRKHLMHEIKDVRDKYMTALENVERKSAISQHTYNQLTQTIKKEKDPFEIVEATISQFLSDTGSSVISADNITGHEILDLYFGTLSPFEKNAAKKDEFPDAIALLSLEKWAQANGYKLLGVSGDRGWTDFALKSDFIDIQKELSVALDMINTQTLISEAEDPHRKSILNILERISAVPDSDERKEIASSLEGALEAVDAQVDAYSNFDYEVDELSIKFKDFYLTDYLDYQTVRSDKNEITIQVGIQVSADVTCSFDLSTWDSIDRESVHLDYTSITLDEKFDASLLLTFEFDDSDPDPEISYQLTEIELVDTPKKFDFGQVELDDSFYE